MGKKTGEVNGWVETYSEDSIRRRGDKGGARRLLRQLSACASTTTADKKKPRAVLVAWTHSRADLPATERARAIRGASSNPGLGQARRPAAIRRVPSDRLGNRLSRATRRTTSSAAAVRA